MVGEVVRHEEMAVCRKEGNEQGSKEGAVRSRRVIGEREPHDTDACNGVFALGSFSQHDIGFVLGEVELRLLRCWFCHAGS